VYKSVIFSYLVQFGWNKRWTWHLARVTEGCYSVEPERRVQEMGILSSQVVYVSSFLDLFSDQKCMETYKKSAE